VVEVERHPETPIKVLGTAARPTVFPLSTPFNAEIINALRYEKVKMPTMDLYDGTTNPEEHLGVYKAQMYCKAWMTRHTVAIFLPSLKGVAQS